MHWKTRINNFLGNLPVLGKYFPTFRPGHYYSPIVDKNEVKRFSDRIFDKSVKEIPEINVNENEQLELLERFWPHFNSLPYKAGEKSGLRYYYPNPFFPLADAAAVSAMMVHFKPKRIIEIGSGFSSAVMLDTNDRFLNNTCQLTFIEPDPVRLYSLLSDEDKKQNKIIPKIIQEVDLGIFNALEAGDILFVDSSHVSKMGSDVNLILFKILPRLKPGTIIHFHDIFFPFEYPEYWVMDFFRGFGWNEAYLIRAYLANNDKYRIIYWNSYLQTFHRSLFEAKFPEYSKDSGGSIWLIRG